MRPGPRLKESHQLPVTPVKTVEIPDRDDRPAMTGTNVVKPANTLHAGANRKPKSLTHRAAAIQARPSHRRAPTREPQRPLEPPREDLTGPIRIQLLDHLAQRTAGIVILAVAVVIGEPQLREPPAEIAIPGVEVHEP